MISWQKDWNFQECYFSSEFFKLTNSFVGWISLRNNCVFWSSLLSYEVLKVINSFHRLNQFARRLRFLNKHFQQWRFCIFPSCFIDEIGFRFFFSQATQASKNWDYSNLLIYWIGSRKYWDLQASYSSKKFINYFNSFSRMNWFEKALRFFSRFFELWKFEIFQFVSHTATVC